MPILDLQQRLRQLGEIRIGHVVATGKVSQKTGKPVTRPAKLDRFRFTSPSKPTLEQVAELYGGTVQPWTPANGGPSEYEVYSTSDRLPVLVPPRDAVSQWYELYAGSKCVRRCDGVTEQKRDRPCFCDPDARQCKITTRVNVMLRDVPALGQWLLITKGYYAGLELPPAAEVLAQVGGYVSGWLAVEERRMVLDDGPVSFLVPTLSVDITPAALLAGKVTGGPAAVTGPERVAITGGRPDYAALAAVATRPEEVVALRDQAKEAGHFDDALNTTLKARWEALCKPTPGPGNRAENGSTTPAAEAAPPAARPETSPAPDEEGVWEAEVVEDDEDLNAIWFQIVHAAGKHGMTLSQVEVEFAKANGGQHPSTATADRLRAFLTFLKGARS